MYDSGKKPDCDEPDIDQIKEWLSSVSGEYRAYLKGALEAFLYVQEIQDLTTDPHCFDFGNRRGSDF